MRLLVIFFDGLGDRPAVELGARTPLEAAATPNLDRLAGEGINGLNDAKAPGYPLGAHWAISVASTSCPCSSTPPSARPCMRAAHAAAPAVPA